MQSLSDSAASQNKEISETQLKSILDRKTKIGTFN